ncbi:Uma2 family endonuclease [Streptomyces zagrosensis]|uniref:Uma2 family endonuclease n=1 Tax=Streptomyces zagrosensis TaxID=1042984 RepID=A0A7W9Q574_9ACTN|nr:Uma2 family endonuclease [Streptomyces zagrosensis]MBB5933027.1 Uma2 family endonuclease [Streptomyces zagrosensis]
MTAVGDRLITEYFENLEVPEGYRAELLRGEIVMMAVPDWVHNMIVLRIQDQFSRDRWHPVTTQDIAIPGEASEPQPDLVVIEHGAFDGPGRLVPAPATTVVLEVVSKTSRLRDYVTKRSMYAAGQVPLYLIVDPYEARCVLLSEPSGAGEAADYRTERTSAFGEAVPLGALGLALDTTDFGTLPAAPLAATGLAVAPVTPVAPATPVAPGAPAVTPEP